jgi:hypothetical protein
MRRYGYKHTQLRPFTHPARGHPQPLAVAALSGGMITSIDPHDIPNENVQVAKNVYVVMDKLRRRNGTANANLGVGSGPVLKFVAVKDKTGALNKVVFTNTLAFDVSSGVPVALPATPLLTNIAGDRVRVAYILDKLVFANNGADPIQQVNYPANTITPLGNAPAYRYITTMFNRVVGAARAGVNEAEVGWSAEYPNFDEWDSNIDETAGSSPIIDTPDDLSDHITGLFSVGANGGILLREKSIWGIAKQPIPQNPFHFYSAFSGLGCDTPNSAHRIRGGIAFVDRKTGCVWAYYLNQAPVPIGQVVENEIGRLITDPNAVFSSYSYIRDEYSLAIPLQGSTEVMEWVYNFKYKQWTYNIRDSVTSIDEIDTSLGGATIDQLGDTEIDNLLGNIDSLSSVAVSSSKKVFGQSTGTISIDDQDALVDFVNLGNLDYESDVTSKIFRFPTHVTTIYEIHIEYKMYELGTLQLQVSKDNVNWITLKTVTPTQVGVALDMIYKKPIRSKRLVWRIKGSTGIWELLGYNLKANPTGTNKESNP